VHNAFKNQSHNSKANEPLIASKHHGVQLASLKARALQIIRLIKTLELDSNQNGIGLMHLQFEYE